jgi:ubiquitin C-terminal hydrolase
MADRFTAGEITASTPPDMPRGLNQLGNTCYLNSLLQVNINVFAINHTSTAYLVFLYH